MSDLVPLKALRRKRTWKPTLEDGSLASFEEHVKQFAEGLSNREQAALSAILRMSPRDQAFVMLGAEPPESLLEPEEQRLFEDLHSQPGATARSLEPALVLIMKGTRYCNLRCSYCGTWRDGPNQRMSFAVLARTVHGAMTAPGVRALEFFWHGGEPTLLPISFYRKALWLQQQFRSPGQTVSNTLQTNGTRLTPEWLDFLSRYHFRVEVSLDGPPEIHDRWRVDTVGRPTSQRVRDGLDKLRTHGLNPAAVMVVGDDVMALGAERMLDYFLEIGVSEVGLQNLVPEGEDRGASPEQRYIEYSRFVEFLRELFHLWWPNHVERITFREISDLLRRIRGQPAGLCLYNENCMGNILTIEPMGDITACDKYQSDPAYRFGNVLEADFVEFPGSPTFVRAHAEVASLVERGTGSCPWSSVCHTGCPFNWYVRSQLGTSDSRSCCGLAPLLSDMAEVVGGRSTNQRSSG